MDYLLVTELPKLGDTREFEAVLPYEIEGFNKTEFYRWRWRYSGTQEKLDASAGRDGYTERRLRELQSFQRHVEQDLSGRGEKLYSIEGQRIPIRGKN
jgi:hypothetical protein